MSVEFIAAPLLSMMLGYALGSIPFGLLLTRFAGAGDLRDIGSGNIGATNVLRTGRKGLAALTLLLDLLKGTAAVVIAAQLFPDYEKMAAAGALFGHVYPVWLKFAGGKGVATLLGVILGLTLTGNLGWEAPAGFAIVWLAVLGFTRFSSLAGISAALFSPVSAAWVGRFDHALLLLGLALLVLWKHRGNLERLMAGTEPRVGASREAGAAGE